MAIEEDYSDFELTLRPTPDFYTPLLSIGPLIKVLSPQWLADEIKRQHTNIRNTFGKAKVFLGFTFRKAKNGYPGRTVFVLSASSSAAGSEIEAMLYFCVGRGARVCTSTYKNGPKRELGCRFLYPY